MKIEKKECTYTINLTLEEIKALVHSCSINLTELQHIQKREIGGLVQSLAGFDSRSMQVKYRKKVLKEIHEILIELVESEEI